jgi:hypothetical protein
MMKRILLFGVMVGLFAGQGQASADLYYTMDVPTAAQLTAVSWSDAQSYGMRYIGYNPGNLADRISGNEPEYGALMGYAVGFAGNITVDRALKNGTNTVASVNIGLGPNVSLAGIYDGFFLPISNDNQQTWEYKLYVDTDAGSGIEYVSPSWTPLAAGTRTTLTLPFGTEVNFSTLNDIGFIIQFNMATTGGNGQSWSDDFHTSVVPVPGALLLGLLGLGTVGAKLRRLV